MGTPERRARVGGRPTTTRVLVRIRFSARGTADRSMPRLGRSWRRGSARSSATFGSTPTATPPSRPGGCTRWLTRSAVMSTSPPAQYRPTLRDGRQLLAHELAHVIQQAGAPNVAAASTVRPAHDAYEQEADQIARAVVSGGSVSRSEGRADGPALGGAVRRPASGGSSTRSGRRSSGSASTIARRTTRRKS